MTVNEALRAVAGLFVIASVALGVRIMRSGDSAPIMEARRARRVSIMRDAAIAMRWDERPGLAPSSARKRAMAWPTAGGLGQDVAALSK